jgi:hypothetical protein
MSSVAEEGCKHPAFYGASTTMIQTGMEEKEIEIEGDVLLDVNPDTGVPRYTRGMVKTKVQVPTFRNEKGKCLYCNHWLTDEEIAERTATARKA